MTGVEGRSILVLGGGGMVGTAVCRELLARKPARIAIAARREAKARQAVRQLSADHPELADRLIPVWGDVFLRAEWQGKTGGARGEILADGEKRRRAIADTIDPLDDDILRSSLLFRMIMGLAPGLEGARAEIVVDCMNTATAVSYQDIYGLARRLAGLAETNDADTDWPREVETLMAALSVPQLVRHVQVLYAAMREASTQAYVKVGTSGTGGMGFNIPYTHGEEKPSRLLLSKAALAGAQTMLTFLMARTPDAPPLVREVKPAALIGWHEIAHGPIRSRGKEIPLFDCPPDSAVSIKQKSNIIAQGDFGIGTGDRLEGVYVDTGENGVFTADEFSAITTLGQMQLITPEEVARTVVAELLGGNTGRDVIAALDGSVSGPTYRGGYLRQAALTRLRQLEDQHGQAVAYEVLGPPRLSKLLYEAHLLKSVLGDVSTVIGMRPEELSDAVASRVEEDVNLRRRILSIGIPILLPDGARLLRGPVIKSANAHGGWVDLTPENMGKWQTRLAEIRREIDAELHGDTSSHSERIIAASRKWAPTPVFYEPGEIAGWVFLREEGGWRQKS
jgi:predicted dinucleotide-binding enzyme